MDGYHIALFIHLFALVSASAAAGITHFAEGKLNRAASIREAMNWHGLISATERVFPLAILALLGTGIYMIEASGAWPWGTGWVEAGVVGTLVLFVSGGILGRRGRVLGRALEQRAEEEQVEAPFDIPRDRMAGALSWMNTCLAIAIVFDMVTKPASLGASITLAVGIACGLIIGLLPQRREVLAGKTLAG